MYKSSAGQRTGNFNKHVSGALFIKCCVETVLNYDHFSKACTWDS